MLLEVGWYWLVTMSRVRCYESDTGLDKVNGMTMGNPPVDARQVGDGTGRWCPPFPRLDGMTAFHIEVLANIWLCFSLSDFRRSDCEIESENWNPISGSLTSEDSKCGCALLEVGGFLLLFPA